ncbi:MAG: universal stress protein [Flammeovirgaceae bacterium]|nr:universal stress protein [Flammeovirgaceae bacterium]
MEKILIAVDESPQSIKAAKTGFQLAKKIKCKIGLVTVINNKAVLGNIDAGVLPAEEVNQLKTDAERVQKQLISDFGNGLTIEEFYPYGDPQKEILDLAKSWNANLIIMSSHGRSGFEHFFKGSIAEVIIHHTQIPVMIVPLVSS